MIGFVWTANITAVSEAPAEIISIFTALETFQMIRRTDIVGILDGNPSRASIPDSDITCPRGTAVLLTDIAQKMAV
jgi:hypothetical protein